MAEFNAIPIFTDAILGDTLHLSAAQFGAYMLLLMVEWRSKDCALLNDDKFLARICRMDNRTWQANKGTILEFFKLCDDAKLRQLRLIDERNYVEQRRSKNVEAGKASALKRKGRHIAPVERTLEPEPNQPTPSPLTSTISQPVVHEPKRAADEIWRQEELPSHWQDYAESKNIPNEQIFKSWTKFKSVTTHPFQLSNWQAWINRERTARAA